MAKGYSAETVGVLDGSVAPARKADGRAYRARMRTTRATFDAALATTKTGVADTNVIMNRYPGDLFRGGSVKVSASLGAANISIGTAAVPAKYMAATAFTTADQPTSFGKVSAMTAGDISAVEEVIMTISGAALTNQVIVIDFETQAR